jgi:putative heme transporter
MSWLILSGIGASVPFGPWNMGVLWVVVRGWGESNTAATSGIALYGVVNELSRLFLPFLGIIVLVVSGDLAGTSNSGAVWAIAILSSIAFVVVTGLIIGIVRSDRIADGLGHTGQRLAEGIIHRLGRSGSPNIDGAIHRFRDQLGVVIQRRGLAALIASIASQFAWILVLIVAMRMCGITESELPAAEIFAVYGLVMVITILPLSPGGAGVPELLFISAFSALAGSSNEAAITAGVFLYRLYFWFVPIPLAWILLKVARRGKSTLPTTGELRDYAKGDA